MNKEYPFTEAKEYFEQNLLDGDQIQEGQLLSTVEVWEVVKGLLSSQVRAGVEDFVTHLAGKRCKKKDTEDFPELLKNDDGLIEGRCYTCEMWEHYDEWKSLKQEEGE